MPRVEHKWNPEGGGGEWTKGKRKNLKGDERVFHISFEKGVPKKPRAEAGGLASFEELDTK